MKSFLAVLMCVLVAVPGAAAQTTENPRLPLVQPKGLAAPPVVITLQDALERARKLDADVQSAVTDVKLAGEDRLQAKTSLLPTINNSTQYLGTQGNGVNPS